MNTSACFSLGSSFFYSHLSTSNPVHTRMSLSKICKVTSNPKENASERQHLTGQFSVIQWPFCFSQIIIGPLSYNSINDREIQCYCIFFSKSRKLTWLMAALLRYGSTIGLHPEYLCAQVATMPFASREQLGFSFLKNSKKKALLVTLFCGYTLGHLGEQRDLTVRWLVGVLFILQSLSISFYNQSIFFGDLWQLEVRTAVGFIYSIYL